MAGVLADDEFGIVSQMKIEIAFEGETADEVFPTTADQYLCRGSGEGSGIDGSLYGFGIERQTVSNSAVIAHVEDTDVLSGCAKTGRRIFKPVAAATKLQRVPGAGLMADFLTSSPHSTSIMPRRNASDTACARSLHPSFPNRLLA